VSPNEPALSLGIRVYSDSFRGLKGIQVDKNRNNTNEVPFIVLEKWEEENLHSSFQADEQDVSLLLLVF